MNIRDIKQQEAVTAYMTSHDRRAIVLAAPRFGKIRVGIGAMKLNPNGKCRTLIAMPRVDIQSGWEKEFKEVGYDAHNVEFVTFNSLKHKVKNSYDFFIIDEPHELSKAQRLEAVKLVDRIPTLGLTGTMTKTTENKLFKDCHLEVCYRYSIAEAVADGILCDYRIFLHEIEMDDKKVINTTLKGRKYTERSWFNVQKFIFKDNIAFLERKLISLIQGSPTKADYTRKLLKKWQNERVLVFCGTTEIANELEIDVYHSKNKDRDVFTGFCDGTGVKQLATIMMMQAGITIKPIRKGLINYINGAPETAAQKISRFLGIEYDNLDKTAEIHIVCLRDAFEQTRLKTALSFFEQEKIIKV